MMLERTIMGEMSQVRFGTTLLKYKIKRSSRRSTVSIAVVPGEGLVVTAPSRATKKRLDELVHAKGAWINQRLKRQSDLPPPPRREFVSGETFRYLGRQYRLKVRSGTEAQVALHGAYLTLGLSKDVTEPQRAPQSRLALVGWYKAKAKVPITTLMGPPIIRIMGPGGDSVTDSDSGTSGGLSLSEAA
jgi:predicted metal-dependent hydrolase